MRREFITGFYGSAGEAAITLDKAVFWTDGRYHIQADHQLDCNWILFKRGKGEVSSENVFKRKAKPRNVRRKQICILK